MDATKGWELQDEENEGEPIYTKEKMDTLLECLDKPGYKDKHLELSSKEEWREIETKIHDMGIRIIAIGKITRKAHLSP